MYLGYLLVVGKRPWVQLSVMSSRVIRAQKVFRRYRDRAGLEGLQSFMPMLVSPMCREVGISPCTSSQAAVCS